MDLTPVTPESIASAKLAQLRERAKVTDLTGVRFTEDGRMRLCEDANLGLLVANAIAAAVYGARGELRTVIEVKNEKVVG